MVVLELAPLNPGGDVVWGECAELSPGAERECEGLRPVVRSGPPSGVGPKNDRISLACASSRSMIPYSSRLSVMPRGCRRKLDGGRWAVTPHLPSLQRNFGERSRREHRKQEDTGPRHCLLPSSERVSVVSRDLQIRAKQWKPRPSSPHPPPSPSQSERVGCGMDADGPTTQELASRMGEGTEEEQWVGKLTNLRIASYGLELCLHCRILPHRICGAL